MWAINLAVTNQLVCWSPIFILSFILASLFLHFYRRSMNTVAGLFYAIFWIRLSCLKVFDWTICFEVHNTQRKISSLLCGTTHQYYCLDKYYTRLSKLQ